VSDLKGYALKLTAALILSAALLLPAGCTKAPGPSQSSSESMNSADSAASAPDTQSQSSEDSLPEEALEFLQLGEISGDETLAVLKTSMGDVTLRFFPEEAPLAVENFLTLAENGYYDGVTFHYVVSDLLIQSGDPTGSGTGGISSFPGPDGSLTLFRDEFSPNLFHFSGALAMVNDGTPDSNGSQFFIVARAKVSEEELEHLTALGYPAELTEAYRRLGGAPQFDYRYTVFGCVADGMDVVQSISRAYSSGGRPVTDITIDSIELINR